MYTNQIELLNERFNVSNLYDKYSNELNNQRQKLLDQISANMIFELNQINEIKTKNNQDFLSELNNSKFKRIVLSLNRIGIRKLIIKEYKFGRMFSASQLVKYKNVLNVGYYILKNKKPNNDIFDLNESFFLSNIKGNQKL